MSNCVEFKQEFQRSFFIFGNKDPKLFVLSQFGPRNLYPVWTGVWLLWHLTWFSMEPYQATRSEGRGYSHYFTFLTHWGYTALGASNLIDFIATLYVHCRRKDIIESKSDDNITPWYLKLVWLMFEISNSISVLITLAFYSLLTPSGSPTNITKHAINSLYVLSNLFVCAKPVRLLHVVYPLTFAVLYSLFSVIYQVGADGDAIYKVLDWENTETTIIYVLALSLIGVPVVHLALFALYKLRIFTHAKCCERAQVNDENDGEIHTEAMITHI